MDNDDATDLKVAAAVRPPHPHPTSEVDKTVSSITGTFVATLS